MSGGSVTPLHGARGSGTSSLSRLWCHPNLTFFFFVKFVHMCWRVPCATPATGAMSIKSRCLVHGHRSCTRQDGRHKGCPWRFGGLAALLASKNIASGGDENMGFAIGENCAWATHLPEKSRSRETPEFVVDLLWRKQTCRKNHGNRQGFRRQVLQQQRQTLEIVKDFACENQNLGNIWRFRIFFIPFCIQFFMFFIFHCSLFQFLKSCPFFCLFLFSFFSHDFFSCFSFLQFFIFLILFLCFFV